LLISACAGQNELTIGEIISVNEDGQQLTLIINSCHANPKVDVDGSADEVILHARGGGTSDDCADVGTVTLREPLGDRVVIDAATDRPVRVPADRS
jgi:hypothetical protein